LTPTIHHIGFVDALAEMFANHRVQPGDTRHALGQLGPAQQPTSVVLQFDVVVLLGPVVPDDQQHTLQFHSGQ
jgi:hypothetical protein